jgi:hypothetical protein
MFVEFNEDLLAAFARRRDDIVASGAFARMRAFLNDVGWPNVGLFAHPLLFARAAYDELCDAAHAMLSAQAKIMRHLCETRSRADVLALFRAPAGMAPYVDWERFVRDDCVIGRLDVVPTKSGYAFCEFNVFPGVGAGESAECYAIFADTFGAPAPLPSTPLADLAALYRDVCRARGLTRIVLLDSKPHAALGYPRQEPLRAYLAALAPEIPVLFADEDSYPAEWLAPGAGAHVLVHRVFTYDEVGDDCRFFGRLWRSGAFVTSTFESELRMSKAWLALLWDEEFRPLLDPREVALIERYLPRAFRLRADTVAHALAAKDRYVFKLDYSYGGVGVAIGKQHSAAELGRRLGEHAPEHWICQEYVEAQTLDLPYDGELAVAPHALVLGLYLYAGKPNGMMVRGSRASSVVNLTHDASMTWARVVDDEEKRRVIERIDSGRVPAWR